MSPNHPNRSKKPKATSGVAARAPRSTAPAHDHDRDYAAFRAGLRTSFDRATSGQTKIFQTDVVGLWQTYLRMLPKSERQIHDCSCCRHFIERFGGLVCIGSKGETWSVIWDVHHVPPFYAEMVRELKTLVERARPTRVFYTRAQVWGTPNTGDWEHLCVVPMERSFVHKDRVLSAGQAMAAVRENIATVRNAMIEYPPPVLDEALRVLATGTLDRSEKFVEPVRWLRKLHDWPKGRQNQQTRENILLREVAMAPEGFCHIKSSVMGPLLDDIKAGVPFSQIERKHRAMLHPLNYQRPQAAPSAGNVRAAEQLVERLGIEPSLHRRFARFEELPMDQAVWLPKIRSAPSRGGVFGHLETKGRSPSTPPSVNMPTQTMTWEKFRRTVLMNGAVGPDEIEIHIPHSAPFFAMVTAENFDAPPILKWDHEDERNPFSTYTYVSPTSATSWGLASGYAKVNGIFPMPQLWGSRPQAYLGEGVMLVIDGCADSRTDQGNALFPDNLRQELHAARSTMEAFSRKATLGGREEASACGLTISTRNAGVLLRAKIGGAWSGYRIDRWD